MKERKDTKFTNLMSVAQMLFPGAGEAGFSQGLKRVGG